MSIVSPERAIQLISQASWLDNDVLRVFWLQVDGSRDQMAESLRATLGREEVFAVIVRDDSFKIANRILADLNLLLESCREQLTQAKESRAQRVTIVALVKESFSKAQVGSPITLPAWFPIRPGLHTHLYITDLLGLANGTLLSGPEAQIDRVAELVFNLERALVDALQTLQTADPSRAAGFLGKLMDKSNIDVAQRIDKYRTHLNGIGLPRGYRPNASEATNSIVSDMLRLVLSRSIDDTAKVAKQLDSHLPKGQRILKPSYLGVALRPRGAHAVGTRNWYALLVGVYQSYQVMNAAAHAGDYGLYAPALVHYSSCDLQLFLEDAHDLWVYE